MKVIVAIIIFNRIDNLKRWIHCWKQCDTTDAELVIIHNDNGESAKFKAICDANNMRYIKRANVGLDIGALQDVCKERLPGMDNDWEYLLWCTDDCLPMSKDFIRPFIEKLQDPSNGISCMQISKSNPGGIWHVRTTGFCISKDVSLRLIFAADPITTKEHCYSFEHRGGNKTISEQIRAMGLSCVQVSPIKISPLWDSQHPNRSLRLNRKYEFDKTWIRKSLLQ